VEDAAAFIEQGHGLAQDFAAGGRNFADADQVGWAVALLIGSIGRLLDDVSHHCPAVVHLNADVVGVEVVLGAHHGVAPWSWAAGGRPVGERRQAAISEKRGDHNADLICAAGCLNGPLTGVIWCEATIGTRGDNPYGAKT
jgi:hypothetical protein